MTIESATDARRQPPASVRGGLVWRLAGLAAAFGFAAILAFAAQEGAWTDAARTAAVLSMAAASAWSVGALAGFLFGIPRTMAAAPGGPGAEVRGPGETRYTVNTNLEQVSDWLTKILVGAGLAELHRVPGALRETSDYFASALGTQITPAASAFTLALLVYFPIAGFAAGYLGTRVLIAPLLRRADTRKIDAATGQSPAG